MAQASYFALQFIRAAKNPRWCYPQVIQVIEPRNITLPLSFYDLFSYLWQALEAPPRDGRNGTVIDDSDRHSQRHLLESSGIDPPLPGRAPEHRPGGDFATKGPHPNTKSSATNFQNSQRLPPVERRDEQRQGTEKASRLSRHSTGTQSDRGDPGQNQNSQGTQAQRTSQTQAPLSLPAIQNLHNSQKTETRETKKESHKSEKEVAKSPKDTDSDSENTDAK